MNCTYVRFLVMSPWKQCQCPRIRKLIYIITLKVFHLSIVYHGQVVVIFRFQVFDMGIDNRLQCMKILKEDGAYMFKDGTKDDLASDIKASGLSLTAAYLGV